MDRGVARSSRWALVAAVSAIALFQAGGALLAYRPATALLLACPQALSHHLGARADAGLDAFFALAELAR